MATHYVITKSDSYFVLSNGDTLQVVSGGSVNLVAVSSGGTAYVSAGGTAASIEMFQSGVAYLGNGGYMSSVVVGSGAKFHMSGGFASRTGVLAFGSMVLSGGSANVVTVGGSRGYLEVNDGILNSGIVGNNDYDGKLRALIKVNGGFLSNTEIRSGGTLWMTEGTARVTTIHSGGLMSMTNGRAISTTLFLGGSMTVGNATADSVYINGNLYTSSGGVVTITNGGTVTNGNADFGGKFRVMAGGSASGIWLKYGAGLEVYGKVENVRALGPMQGFVDVKSGGTVTDILFSNFFTNNTHNGATLNVSLGGVASSGGIIERANVYYGGKVSEFDIYSSGQLHLYGGTATAINLMLKGQMFVSGGLAQDTVVGALVPGIVTVDNWGQPASMSVLANGSASNTIVSAGGVMMVRGGVAADTTVNSNGLLAVSGGLARNLTVNWGGEAWLRSGGWVSGGNIAGGRLEVNSGCSAENMLLGGGNGQAGHIYVGSGGFVKNITAVGSLYLGEGAAAADTVVSYGTAEVHGNAALSRTEIISGEVRVYSGGSAVETLVRANARLNVSSGGLLRTATVESGGLCRVSSGGIAESLTVKSGGTAIMRSGSIISGAMAVNGGAVRFDLSELAAPDASPLVANFSLLTGTPNYQAVVAAGQTMGTYILADGISSFGGSITVKNTADADLGVLKAGESLKYNDEYFKLAVAGDDLVMIVSDILLEKPEVLHTMANTTAKTNQPVTVTASFSANAVFKEYSFDQNAWASYVGGVKMSANGTVYFRCGNSEGNSVIKSYTVTNIDNIPPDAPVVTANTQALTAGPVTITATFSADSVTKQYSTDSLNWQPYSAPISVDTNGTWFFRGIDEAGNASALGICVVYNIVDAGAPAAPVASADITAPTNQNVTVTATFGNDSVTKEYSLDNKTWMNYTGGVKLTDNGIVYFRGKNSLGISSPVAFCQVDNIDKTPPAKPFAGATITAPTNQNVTVTATFSADSAQKQYSLDNKTWKSYTSGIVMTANGTVYFRGIDAVGNVSEVTSYAVTNITSTQPDTVPPAKPTVSADVTAATNGKVTVSATFSTDSAQKQYSLDNKTWKAYTSGVVMSANGTVYFRGIDAAGNISAVASYAVTNIDKVAPVKPTAKASTTAPTTQSVTVTATFSTDSAQKQYSLDSKTWKAYTSGVVMSANGTVYFRGIDAAGNISDVTSYAVMNISQVTVPDPPVSENPEAPKNFKVVVSKYNAALTWAKYAAEKGVKVTYEVFVDGKTVAANGNKFTLKNAEVGIHSFAVRAVLDGKTRTNWSENIQQPIADITAPKSGKVTITQTAADSVKVAWSAATDNVGIDHYVITCGSKSQTLDGKTLSAVFTGVGGKVDATVTAYDAAGNAGKTVKKSVKLADVTAPTQATGLAAQGTVDNKSGGILTWKASTDNSGAVAQYLISISGESKVYKSKTNSLKLKKLAAGSYTFTVVAVDKAKNESPVSAVGSFTVKDVIDPKVKKLSAKVTDDTALVTWNATDETGLGSLKLSVNGGAAVDVTGLASYKVDDLAVGVNKLRLIAYDTAENMAFKEISVKVKPPKTAAMLASVA